MAEAPTALSASELRELLEHVDAERTRRVRFTVRVLAHTGLRAAELAHMTSDWVRGATVAVPEHESCSCSYCQKQRDRNADRSDAQSRPRWHPKSQAAVRTVPIANPVTRETMAEHFDEYGEVQVGPNALWRRVTKVDVPGIQAVSPLRLRHTYATRLAEEGVPVRTIQYALGHSEPKHTLDYIDRGRERDGLEHLTALQHISDAI